MGVCHTKEQTHAPNALATSPLVRKTSSIKSQKSLRKSNSIGEIKFRLSDFVSQNHENLYKVYKILSPALGRGAYGEVRKAIHLKTGEARAIKMLLLQGVNTQSKRKLINEVNIMKCLDHPHIVKIYEFFDHESALYIVMEYLEGEPLLDYLIRHSPAISEKMIADIIHQILSAIFFMHLNGIVHRDIKSENIVFDGKNITVIDFGTSKIMTSESLLREAKGTAFYMAPEVIKGSYNEKCDIWSCGIVLYILLTGRPPFEVASKTNVFNQILNLDFDLPLNKITGVSKEALNLLHSMLEEKPENRIRAEDALKHPFFDKRSSDNNPQILVNVVKNMESFIFKTKLQEAIFMYIFNALVSQGEKEELIRTFKAMDVNNDGVLSKQELRQGLIAAGKMFSDEEIDEIFTKIDIDGSGTISYSEYMAAAIDKDRMLSEEKLIKVFKIFDKVISPG
jgi:calcium-dependent protein kinase